MTDTSLNPYAPRGITLHLRARLFLAFIAVFLVPLCVFAYIAVRIMFSGVSTIENGTIQDSLQLTQTALTYDMAELSANVVDYSHWDEMYDPAISRDPEWLRRNVTDWIPDQFHVDVIWLADQEGHVYYQYHAPREFQSNVSASFLFQSARKGEFKYGLLNTSAGLMEAASSFVAPSAIDGPFDVGTDSPAVLFYGRFVNSDTAKSVSALTGRALDFFDKNGLVGSSKDTHASLIGQSRKEVLPIIDDRPVSDGQIFSLSSGKVIMTSLTDVEQEPVGSLAVYQSFPISTFVESQLSTILIVALLMSLLIGVVIAIYFGSRLAGSINRLNSQVGDYTRGDYHHPVVVDRKDEIGQLQASFAFLIHKLERARVSIEERDMTILDILAKYSENEKKPRRKRGV